MIETAESLEELIDLAVPLFRAVDASAADQKRDDMHWTPKERLGHLIDAASNHHQHLVRASLDEILAFPEFDHTAWVSSQRYSDAPWDELVELWVLLNRHLARLVRAMPLEKWKVLCLIGHNKPVPLERLHADYVKLVKRQLKHFHPPSP